VPHDSILMQKASALTRKLSPGSTATAPGEQGRAAVLDGLQEQLLELSVHGTGPADDVQAALVGEMVELLGKEIVPGMDSEHSKDVAATANATTAVHQCYTSLVEQNKTKFGQAEFMAAERRGEHLTCQRQLQSVENRRLEICSRAAEVLSDPPCPPPSGIEPADLRAVVTCYDEWLANNATNHTRQCEEVTAAWTEKKASCAEVDKIYESEVCNLRSLRTSMCQDYSHCYVVNRAAYEELKKAVSAEAAGRQHEARAIARMHCMLDMVKEDAANLAGDAGATKLQGCSETSGDEEARKYQIHFDDINLTLGCPLSGIGGHELVECNSSLASPGCDYDVPVLITDDAGFHLQDAGGKPQLTRNAGDWEHWLLSPAGDGQVSLTSHRGEKLAAESALTMAPPGSSSAGQAWQLEKVAGVAGQLRIRGPSAQHLQSQDGFVQLVQGVESSTVWNVTRLDLSPACAMPPSTSTTTTTMATATATTTTETTQLQESEPQTFLVTERSGQGKRIYRCYTNGTGCRTVVRHMTRFVSEVAVAPNGDIVFVDGTRLGRCSRDGTGCTRGESPMHSFLHGLVVAPNGDIFTSQMHRPEIFRCTSINDCKVVVDSKRGGGHPTRCLLPEPDGGITFCRDSIGCRRCPADESKECSSVCGHYGPACARLPDGDYLMRVWPHVKRCPAGGEPVGIQNYLSGEVLRKAYSFYGLAVFPNGDILFTDEGRRKVQRCPPGNAGGCTTLYEVGAQLLDEEDTITSLDVVALES